MLPRLRQFLFSRNVRCFFAVALVAAAWGWWWFGPTWPIRSYRFDDLMVLRSIYRSINHGNHCFEWRNPPYSNRTPSGTPFPSGFRLVQLENGKILTEQRSGIGEWAASPTGDYLVAADLSGWRVLDTATGKMIARTDSDNISPAPNSAIRISADGRRFGIDSQGVAVFDTKAARLIAHFQDVRAPFDLSPDGQRLIANGTAQRPGAILIDIATHKTTVLLNDNKRRLLEDVRFNPTGNIAATRMGIVGPEDEIHIWNIADAKLLAQFSFASEPATRGKLWFSPDGRFLVTQATLAQVIDLSTLPPIDRTAEYSGLVTNLTFADGGSRFAVNQAMTWTVYESATGATIREGDKAAMSWIRLSPAGNWIMLWDQKNPTSQNTIASWIQRAFGKQPDGYYEFSLIQVENGRTKLKLKDTHPAYSPLFDSEEKTVWTLRIIYDSTAGRFTTILDQWSLKPTNPPWWLWLITVLGLILIVVEIVRARRRKMIAPA